MADVFWNFMYSSLENKLVMFLGCFAILPFVVIYLLFLSKNAKYECWIFHRDGITDDGRTLLRICSYYILFMKKKKLSTVYADIYSKFNWHKYVRLFRCWKGQVLIRDLEMAIKVLFTNPEYFKDRANIYYHRNKDQFTNFDKSLLICTSFLLTYDTGNLKDIYPIIWKYAMGLEDLKKTSLPGSTVDWQPIFNEYGLQVLFSAMLGIKTLKRYKLKILELSKSVVEPLTLINKLYLFVLFQQIEAIGGMQFNKKRVKISSMKHFHNLFEAAQWEGQVNNHERNEDYLRLLAYLKRSRFEDYEEILSTMIASKLFGIIALTSELETIMCSCLYELANNTEIQDKLYQALDQLPDVWYHSVRTCEYLDMVISETLRKYPPVCFIQRECINNYQFPNDELNRPNLMIKKGTQVFISIKGIQNDPALFPEPDRFNPDRFNRVNVNKIKPLSYMPYGTGSIGIQFNILVIKTGLAILLRKYRVFQPENVTPYDMESRTRTGGLWLSFEERIGQGR